MRFESRVCLSTFLLLFCGALAPPERLFAQQVTGATTPAPAPQEIDKLTGPIALYPDALIFQIVAASGDYGVLLSFAGWMEQNAALKGTALQDAAKKAGFSDALIALAPFPQVIQMMVQKPDWTKALGAADTSAIFDSIQQLRAQAQALGNLKTTPQQIVVVTNVVVEKTVEQQVVVVTNTIVQIQPANPQVIYVPTYPQTVYVQQAPPPSSASVAGAALVGFSVGVILANNSHSHCYHHYDNYWEHREDYYEDRQENARENQDQRQSTAQGNQDQRQSAASSAQSQGAANQSQRQSTAQASQSQGQPAATPSSRGGAQTASKSSGMSSGASYQSGSATRAQSSRGSASMSSSRSGGGRSGGGRGR